MQHWAAAKGVLQYIFYEISELGETCQLSHRYSGAFCMMHLGMGPA